MISHDQTRLRAARGFTLVELMVVVLIVAILALVAVPAMMGQMRERRSAEAAQRVSSLYRLARLRAMGRGSAVLVRYDNQRFQVLEAVQGAGSSVAGCATMPLASCVAANFNSAADVLAVTNLDPTALQGVSLTATDATAAATTTTQLDVCYTPLGRAFTRTLPTNTFNPMTGVATVTVSRTGGRSRRVTVLPNGVARLAL